MTQAPMPTAVRTAAAPAAEARTRRRLSLLPAAVVALAIGAWWGGSVSAGPGIVPSPGRTVVALDDLLHGSQFWSALGETALTWLLAIGVCAVVGIPLGLAIGHSELATGSTRLTIDFLRNIPPVALVPVGLLLFGPTRRAVLLLVIAGTIWPVMVQSIYAARQGEPQLDDVARAFHLSRWARLTRIFLPGVTPFVMTGLRVAVTICLLLTITGELLGGSPGIGTQMQKALVANDNPRVYAYVVVSALLGVGINRALWAAQRRLLFWHPSFRQDTP